MIKWLNNYFVFTRKELNGMIVLVLLIVAVSAFPTVYRWFKPIPDPGSEALKSIIDFVNRKHIQASVEAVSEAIPLSESGKVGKTVLFDFDPNVLDLEGWQRLGLSERQAKVILNYRTKGGQFRKKEDVQKMYTIDAQMYSRLEPYIHIPATANRFAPQPDKLIKGAVLKATVRLVELNIADTVELDGIRGIGKVFAARIVKYRERLGGFVRKEQLLEVFGIDSLKYLEVRDQVTVDQEKVKKINVNTVQLADFKYHPYIRYKQANALIEYRKQHGNYSNIADLNKVAILTPELISKLAPYLTF